MLLILRFLAAKGLDKFTEFPGCHVMMIGPVYINDRSQRASTQAVNVFDGEKTVRGHSTRFNSELAGGLVEEKAGTPDVTGRAQAHGENIFAGRV
jgi:hypothetical protein